MKKKLLKTIILSVLFTLSISCTGSFDDINNNPLKSTTLDPELVLPYVEWGATNIYYDTYQLGVATVIPYAQYLSSEDDGDRYMYRDGYTTSGLWLPYYTRVLKNVKEVTEIVKNQPESTRTLQLLRIMNAYNTASITDDYGDIPYSDAGTGNGQAKYDTQKEVYYSIFKELTEAVNILSSDLKNQKAIPSDADYIYGADFTKWIKFANSLRLRYAIRLSFIDPNKAKEEGKAALAAGVMSSTTDGATIYTDDEDWNNLGYPLMVLCNWNWFRASTTLINILENTSSVTDPREELYLGKTKLYVTQNEGPAYKGVPNGLPADQSTALGTGYNNDETSNVYGLMFFPDWNSKGINPQDNNPWLSKRYPLMHYSEVCFLKAEAALRGWNGAGDAESNYLEGIKTSFIESRDGINSTLYDSSKDETYITSGNVAWNNADNFEAKLKKIITQKWIAIFPMAEEAWAEFRRTGYPDFQPILQCSEPTLKKGEFIKKTLYPDEERRNNTVNATAKTLNNGQGDGANVRVWWDTGRYK